MLAPAADRGIDSAASASSSATSGRGGPNINPSTGLSTDYLNHFTEAVMLLEMVGTMPECLDDLRAWDVKTYPEHFAASHFSNRNAIIAAYQSADPSSAGHSICCPKCSRICCCWPPEAMRSSLSATPR